MLIRVPQGPRHDCWVGGAQSPGSWLHLALPTAAAVAEPPPPGEQKKRPRRPVRPETLGKRKVDSMIQDSVQGVLQGEGGREAVGKMLSTWESRSLSFLNDPVEGAFPGNWGAERESTLSGGAASQ